jgi:hypothetical protein
METEHIKTKRFVKSWLTCIGEIPQDHQRFSKYLAKVLVEQGTCALGDFESANLSARRLKALAKKRPTLHFNESHRIDGHVGITLRETGIVLSHKGGKIYAMSAWDALAIPVIVGREFELTSVCVVTGKEVEVRLTPMGYETQHENLYLSFYHPDVLTLDVCLDVSKWSSFILGEEASIEYLKENPDQVLLPLSQAFQMAREVVNSMYKEA